MDLRFKHPFSLIVAGPSGSGKSILVQELLRRGLKNLDVDYDDILWCYSEWHPQCQELRKKVRFQKGIENIERIDSSRPMLIVIDDLMRESNENVVDLFTRGCHHSNASVIFITQNVFHQSKGQRDISLNAHYMILFKNPRDGAQIAHLARQVCPWNPKFLQEAYGDATNRAHGYILLDMKQDTPEECRYRTNIYGEKEPGYEIVYKPKRKQKT